mmetsp:Transcript_10307/g.30398  ORF Transcript_10307/g.30398 Transcript_10307/m.30398 type:complete len:81 (-) Transcript_10307:96-338(-)
MRLKDLSSGYNDSPRRCSDANKKLLREKCCVEQRGNGNEINQDGNDPPGNMPSTAASWRAAGTARLFIAVFFILSYAFQL